MRCFPAAIPGPNDPQTYHCDARIFRVTFAPGGTAVPITESGGIPPCPTLPAVYGYEAASRACSGVANKEFGGARLSPRPWDCAVGDLGHGTFAATDGVLCRWKPLTPAPTCQGRPATIYVRNGKIVGGPDHGKPYRGILRGTAGDDVIVGTAGRDLIMGFAGRDVICGGEGHDVIDGGDGDDRIDGGPGNDLVKGQKGTRQHLRGRR